MARVLIVDDDRAIRELLRFALEGEGYTVTVLRNGVELLAHLRDEAEHVEQAPETEALDSCVILMDVMMPLMDGWEACRHLAANPALFGRRTLALMTAVFQEEETIPPPAQAILRKPFDLEQVYTLVATLSLPALPAMPAPPLAGSLAEPALLVG